MKVYVTKYAVGSKGKIISCEGRPCYGMDEYIWIERFGTMRLGVDAHEAPEAALLAAEASRKKRIASLKKQVDKLEALTFLVVEESV